MRREIESPIAGSIWSHVATVNQRVKAGAILIVAECMKSEFAIEASVDGTVVWLKSCGEEIQARDVVAILDVAEP